MRTIVPGIHQWERTDSGCLKQCAVCGIQLVLGKERPYGYGYRNERWWTYPDGRKVRAGNGCRPPLCEPSLVKYRKEGIERALEICREIDAQAQKDGLLREPIDCVEALEKELARA